MVGVRVAKRRWSIASLDQQLPRDRLAGSYTGRINQDSILDRLATSVSFTDVIEAQERAESTSEVRPSKAYAQPTTARSRRFLENKSKIYEHSTKAIMSEDQHTDVPPNHLSIDPRSAFYSEEVLRRDVGIRFNGAEKTNVHEYNVAEGWVRVEVPTAKDRRGNPMVVKLSGTVEPYFR